MNSFAWLSARSVGEAAAAASMTRDRAPVECTLRACRLEAVNRRVGRLATKLPQAGVALRSVETLDKRSCARRLPNVPGHQGLASMQLSFDRSTYIRGWRISPRQLQLSNVTVR